ncbi:Ig-like domain-containing protein [Acidovorax sp. sic0104]|uniref:Ig-like domain-containing protein n=1 Tax=Acidovorax sp. sic0104 TaxID=2854784 RepID=UPI001C46E161|nr:Ig-like domain-containing protein [Acidovorax sp. sic0104]MBV7540297.1 hypothetical protein [Acidovorax sp. sic0104]
MTAEIHASVVTIDKSATSKAGVVDRSAGIKTVVTPGQGNPARISAKGGATIELLQADSKWAPEIVKVRRVGSDLQVDFLEDSSGSSDLVIEGFYEQEGAKLVGYGKDGEVYDYVAQSDSFDQSLPFLMDGGEPVIQVLAEPATAFGVVGGFAALPMWLAGGAVLSTAAIAAQDPGSPAPVPAPAPAPHKPIAPTSYNDNAAPVINARSAAAATNDTTPGLNIGTGLLNPKLYVNGKEVAATYDPKTGTLTPDTPLAEGAYSLTYTHANSDGVYSEQSAPLMLTVDVTAPAKPAPATGYNDNVGAVQNASSTAATTDDNTPGLNIGSGHTQPKLYVDGVLVAATYDAAMGTLTPGIALSDGAHQLTYTVSDAAGNESAQSDPTSITVITTGVSKPSAPSSYDDNAAPVLNTQSTAFATNDATPGLNVGRDLIDPRLYVDGLEVPAIYNPLTGTLTPTAPLPEGNHRLTFTQSNDSGGVSEQSDALVLLVDTVPPATPLAAPAGYKDDVGLVQSANSTAPTTDDNKPGVLVGVNLSDTPKLYVDGVQVAASYDPITGTLTPLSALADGARSLSYTLTDAAGNESGNSPALSLTIMGGGPQPGSEGTLSLMDDVGAIQGLIALGGVTDDTRPTFSGIGAGPDVVKVNVYDANTLLGTANLNSNGEWSYELTTPLAIGDHSLTARPVNAAGVEGQAGKAWTFKVQGDAPTMPVIAGVSDNLGGVTGNIAKGAPTDDPTPTVNGTGTAGSTIKLYADGVEVGSTTVAADGSWTVTSTALTGDGTKLLTAKAFDSAGQASPETSAYAILLDTTAPAKPSPIVATDDQGTVLGTVANGGTTDDTTPILSGAGAPGDLISVYDGSSLLGRVMVQANGTWSFALAQPLSAGAHAITATATDPAGNTSAPSDPLNLVVDFSAPQPGSEGTLTLLDDVGAIKGEVARGSVTDDARPTFKGSGASADVAKVNVYDGAVLLGSATVTNGSWSFEPTTPLASGDHNLTARPVDAAGNEGPASNGWNFKLLGDAPAAPAITGVSDNAGSVTGSIAKGATTDDTTADSNDVVRLDDANWTNTGATATVDNHTYAVWSNAGAHLLVDNNATLHQVI